MKVFAFFFVALLASGLLPAAATAQLCPDQTPIACGEVAVGDTTGEPNDFDSDCSWGGSGPEADFVFTAAADGQILIETTTAFDAILEVIADESGDCASSGCVAHSDSALSGGTESLTLNVSAGTTYHIVVDGYYSSSEGAYELSLSCFSCVDADGDGFFAYDETTCPMGDDCDDSDAFVNPDAVEICGDGIDNDCVGGDAICPYCDPGALSISCDESVEGDTTGAEALDIIDVWDYCGGSSVSAANPELTYALSLTETTPVTISLSAEFDSVLVLLQDTDGCDPLAGCLAIEDEIGDGEVIATVLQPGTYYIVVDGWGSSSVNEGAFSLTVDCSEICEDADGDGYFAYDADACPSGTDCDDNAPGTHPGAVDVCGDQIDQDCSGTPNSLCGEVCTDLSSDPLFCGDCDTDCSLLTANVDAALCVLGICDYEACATGHHDCDSNRSNGCEQVENLENCGACGYDCGDYLLNVADSLCDAGACDYLNCQTGFLDCNGLRNDGCEFPENVANCGACGYDCATDAGLQNVAGLSCEAGACAWTDCAENFGDCDEDPANGCETRLDSSEHCGTCGNRCARLEACIEMDGGWGCSAQCADADGDGYADAACGGSDCDDDDPDVFPGAVELCNDLDDDCDGNIDEGFDADGDGYKTCGAEPDCDDTDPDIHPGAEEICGNDVDENCDGVVVAICDCIDADKDGAQDSACGGPDCNDDDPSIGPHAVEICDGVDNNCDGQIDENDVCFQGADGCGCATADPLPVTGGFMLLLLAWTALRRRDD